MDISGCGTAPCGGCAGLAHGFCGRLTPAQVERLCGAARHHHLRPGGSLAAGARREPGLVVVRAGMLRHIHGFRDGRRQVLDFVFPGEVMLRRAEPGDGSDLVEATGPADLCEIPLAAAGLEAEAGPGAPLAAAGCEEVARKNRQCLVLGRKRAEERLASFLLDYAGRLPSGAGERRSFRLEVPRGDIADYLCLTRETVSRCFTLLREAGLVALRGAQEVTLADPAGLGEVARGERPLALQ